MGLTEERGAEEAMTPAEGVTGVALYAIIADEMVTDEELSGLRNTLSRMRMFADPRLIQRGLDKALALAKVGGDAELLRRAAPAIPEKLRPTAFALATDLILADGHVDEREEEYLARIQRALGLEDGLADKIVEVMVIRNSG